jgi:hypothetical protein
MVHIVRSTSQYFHVPKDIRSYPESGFVQDRVETEERGRKKDKKEGAGFPTCEKCIRRRIRANW